MTSIRTRKWTNADGKQTTKYVVDYRDQSGKRRSKQFNKRKEANAWRVGAESQVKHGTHTPDSQTITVADAAIIWLKEAERKGRERSTLHGYDNLIRLHIVPFIGAEKLNGLTYVKVDAYRSKLQETRSLAVTKKAVSALSMILNEAMRKSLVAQNVVELVRFDSDKRRKERVEIPSRHELKALISASADDDPPIILTLIFTGLRASELRGLRWQDVNLKIERLTVAQRADQWNQIGQPKSSAAYRSIPMPPMLVKALKVWKLACPKGELDLVFPNARGGVFGYHNLLRRVFFPVQIKAGLTRPALNKHGDAKTDKDGQPVLNGKYGFHALRHAAASGWIEQNVDLKRLQAWMGHESIQITLNTYGHLLGDADKDAAIAGAAQDLLLG